MDQKIDPKQLMQQLTLAELCQTAEDYYRTLPDPYHQMSKPFASTLEAPGLLYKMGLLLSGLRLGKSMVVLDFGAGTCWFSRFLNQMQCVTISVDASRTALELGRQLFEISPIVGEYVQPPRFVPFDGQRMEVADASVDRIVCFDVFHHVPNQEQILREFYRVLKPGGIVGFSEPGMRHSQTAQAQYEMQNYRVLENDIRLDEIKDLATEIGFGDLRVKLVTNPASDLSYDDYVKVTGWNVAAGKGYVSKVLALLGLVLGRNAERPTPRLGDLLRAPFELLGHVAPAMQNLTVFFLTKGSYVPDSRSHAGLGHEIELLTQEGRVRVGEPLELEVRLKNVGQSKWLHRNIQDIGVVKIGGHLLDANQRLLDHDFARCELQTDVMPGQEITQRFAVTFPEPGEYILAIDMVAEHICWFEVLGCKPQLLHVSVT